MSCERFEPLLDEFTDDELSRDRRDEVERHLASCAPCRERVARRRSLGRAARDLACEIAPPRDLWPKIRSTLESGKRTEAKPHGPAWARWGALAASVLLVSFAAITALRDRNPISTENGDPRPGPRAAAPASTTGSGYLFAAELEYEAATELLMGAIEEKREHLSPEALEVLERNLAIIDDAIDEIRDTLAESPDVRGREQTLTAMYRKRIELLWRVSRLTS